MNSALPRVRKNLPMAGLALALGLLTAGQGSAAPLIADLTGTVTATTGDATPFLNTGITTHAVFDLDEGNALEKLTLNEAGLISTRWTFSGAGVHTVSPYNQSTVSGAFGTFSNPDFVEVETYDNLDLSLVGNPFGMTGVVDVLSVSAIIDIADCSNGIIDPDTGGCSDPYAPILEGEHHMVHFVGATSWFTGDGVLPTQMLDLNNLLAVFGEVQSWESGAQNATAEITYATLALSGDTGSATSGSVPVPMPVALMLAALPVLRRRMRNDRD